jgi:hypothetical protein
MAVAKKSDSEVFVMEVMQGAMDFCVIGTSPIILNRMSEKTRGQLLLPSGRKNAAEKASTLKHDPLAEFRASAYTSTDEDSPTRLQLLASMFKGAMRTAALDLPGASKSQIGRLVYVEGDRVSLYGEPQIMLAVTRSSDINRTPDVRSRAIVREWACRITVKFVRPIIRDQSVANLLAAGGITSGIGDWRIGKGAGSYGGYRLCSEDDADFVRICKIGRAEQDAAIENPRSYDDETESLLAWHGVEVKRRGFKVA